METGARRTWDQPESNHFTCIPLLRYRWHLSIARHLVVLRQRDKSRHPGWVLGPGPGNSGELFPWLEDSGANRVGKRPVMEGQTDTDSQTPDTTVPRAKRGNEAPDTDNILITTHSQGHCRT